LRHTHITHAIEEGVPIEVVMAQVGHLSPEMTRYYTHLGSHATHTVATAVQRKGSVAMSVLTAEPEEEVGSPAGPVVAKAAS
jgi:hypothetical protein